MQTHKCKFNAFPLKFHEFCFAKPALVSSKCSFFTNKHTQRASNPSKAMFLNVYSYFRWLITDEWEFNAPNENEKLFFVGRVADSERVCTENGRFLMHSAEITKDLVQWNKFPTLRTEAEGTFCANVTIAHKNGI